MLSALLLCGVACALTAIWLTCADRDFCLYAVQVFGRRNENVFRDKVVWITGASGGLGALMAKHFSERGAKLILSSRSAERLTVMTPDDTDVMTLVLQNVAQECGNVDHIHILPFDICNANWKSVAAAAEASHCEGIDYVIHNAGISQHALASSTQPHVVNELFQINALAAMAMMQALLPGMIQRGKGHVVVISSMAGKVPSPGQAIYSGAKHALMGYFHSLRAELAATNIGVTIVCPGPFKLPNGQTTRRIYKADGLEEERMARSKGTHAHDVVRSIALAMEYRLSECWIAKHPVLMMAYLMQYCPVVGSMMLDWIGPRRAAAVQKGQGYSMHTIFGKEKST